MVILAIAILPLLVAMKTQKFLTMGKMDFETCLPFIPIGKFFSLSRVVLLSNSWVQMNEVITVQYRERRTILQYSVANNFWGGETMIYINYARYSVINPRDGYQNP